MPAGSTVFWQRVFLFVSVNYRPKRACVLEGKARQPKQFLVDNTVFVSATYRAKHHGPCASLCRGREDVLLVRTLCSGREYL
jgi:hypothetical protein